MRRWGARVRVSMSQKALDTLLRTTKRGNGRGEFDGFGGNR